MNQEIELLVFKAYHGGLSETERDFFTEWVAASSDHARRVIEYSVDANSIAIAVQSSQAAKAASTRQTATKHRITVSNPTLLAFQHVAAPLVAFTLLGLALWFNWVQPALESHGHTQLTGTSPMRLASMQIMESADLNWNRYTNPNGDSEMTVIPASGFLYHEFRGGGFILLEGPMVYQLESSRIIRLIEGRLVARAETDEPFVILVDNNRITLEGAEFGVQTIDDNVASAIVFEGSVEVTQGHSEGQSTVISAKAGQTIMLQPHINKAEQLSRATQADSDEYARLLDSVKLRPSYTSNKVQFLADAPKSLLPGELSDGSHVQMFCERVGVSVEAGTLPRIPKNLTDLGEIPPDLLLLDSYILHFDSQADGCTVGMVIFDRPIVAVLGSAFSIRSTDALFGNANTAYPRTPSSASGHEDADEWGIEYDVDCIKVDSDGKTLLFRVMANQEVDQIRILVEAREPTQLSD